MLMHRHSGYIIHEHANRMYFKQNVGLVHINLGPVVLQTWDVLSWAEFYHVGRVGMYQVDFGPSCP